MPLNPTLPAEAATARPDAAADGKSILFVSHTGRRDGGAEIVLGQLMVAAAASGFRVSVAAPAGELLDWWPRDAAQQFALPLTPLHRTRSLRCAVGMLGGWCATSVRLGRIIRRSNVDLVHANSGVAALLVSVACILTRTPFIWHQHDIVPSRRVNKLVLGLCGRASTSVLAVSKAVAQSLTALGVPAGRVTVLHNAVRPEFFQPLPGKPSARRSLDLPTDGFIVAMAGRLVPYKGHGLLLDAVAALNRGGLEVTAAIAGAAPEYEAPDNDPFPDYSAQLQARGRHDDLAGRVVFLGRQSDIRTVLAAADVLAVPSFLEPFPLVVLEGLASGVPVVASDSGGHPEAIRHGESGLLFKTGDVADLTEKLNQLLIDDGLRRRTSEAGRQRVRAEFSEDRFQERLLRIYDDILSGASRGLNVGAC